MEYLTSSTIFIGPIILLCDKKPIFTIQQILKRLMGNFGETIGKKERDKKKQKKRQEKQEKMESRKANTS
jgi:hypothetical protein